MPSRPPSTPGRRAPLLLGLAALVMAAALGGGWWWRERQETLHRAILLTGGDPERGRGFLRLSYAGTRRDMEEAIRRLRCWRGPAAAD